MRLDFEDDIVQGIGQYKRRLYHYQNQCCRIFPLDGWRVHKSRIYDEKFSCKLERS